MAKLAELVRAVDDLEPRQGAKERVLQAVCRRRPSRSWWLVYAVIVLLMVIVVRIDAFIGAPDGGSATAATPPSDGLAVTAAPSTDGHPSTSVSRDPVSAIPPALPLPVPDAPDQAATVRAPLAPEPQLDRPAVQRKAPRVARDSVAGQPELPGPSAEPPIEPPPAPQQLATDTRVAAIPDLPPVRLDDPVLVYDATRALRGDRDAQTASRKLETYRRLYPSGDLAEEALALLIEALIARFEASAGSGHVNAADADHVRALAREYLQRYPQGRSRAFAEEAARWSDRPSRSGTMPESTSPDRRRQRAPARTLADDLVELYRTRNFQVVVRACSYVPVTEANAAICTLAACQVGDSANAERWRQLSPPADRAQLGKQCLAIVEDGKQ